MLFGDEKIINKNFYLHLAIKNVMKKEELLAALRLQKSKLIGDISAKKLISIVGSASGIFEEKNSLLTKIDGVGALTLKSLRDPSVLVAAEQELETITKQNISYSYFLQDDYPENLKHCIDGPILFFKQGNMNLKSTKLISIVGTRNMTSYGRDFCKELILSIKDYQPIIVSGFAYGVDICAHKEALSHGLSTLAVLGSGLGRIYPKVHQQYKSEIQKQGGFITEFWHQEQPLRENFLKRNRIIAGISQATVVIESAEKGGSLVTANIANSYNRDVFAVPGRIQDQFSKGCNHLIKSNQALMLTHPEDLIRFLNWDMPFESPKPVQKQLFIELTPEEQKVYDHLQESGKQLLDSLSLDVKIPIHKLSSILLEMELKGVLRPLPGKQFEVI